MWLAMTMFPEAVPVSIRYGLIEILPLPQIISLITRQRIDYQGIVQGVYGDSAFGFLATVAAIVKGTTDRELRRELLDHLMHLHVERHPEGIHSRLFGGAPGIPVNNAYQYIQIAR